MPEASSGNLVDSATIATLFDVTERRVQQLAQQKIITARKIKGVYKYDVLLVVRQYIKHLSDKVNNRDSERSKELEEKRVEADIKLKVTKARKEELHLNELEGSMHRSEDVEAMTSDLANVIRSMLMALPGRLAVDLAEIRNPSEVSERVRHEVYGILEELANYKYDPGEYRRRVREREGWRDLEDNASED